MNRKIELHTLRRAKSNGTIHFVQSLKLEWSISFSADSPKTLYFLCNSFSLWFREKSSQTKTISRKVFFVFCLEHFSLYCIIKMLILKVNDPLKENCPMSNVQPCIKCCYFFLCYPNYCSHFHFFLCLITYKSLYNVRNFLMAIGLLSGQ